MAYQVLARKWRPQRFDDVIGQPGVTRTLRNAIARERVAQAFVFAGPRGVGKTTTARILARALNCVEGPTADPCGECDACREVAEGRDIDVLEIDAATHTQVDNVREVIISGLSIAPVRDRHKVFIIDEVHQLSSSSFNALLKSVEEPPPHVVFIMATTLLDKIPDTILSRSQVFEFRTIGTAAIVEQLQRIVEAEGVAVDEAGLALVARTANGSMRDAQSALDQVIAFAGDSVGAEDVSAVLGLVGRDAVLEMTETVAAEAADRVFDLAGRFVEAGYDLRSVCRELARLVRDLLVVKVDPRRIADPEIAVDAERDRVQALAKRFSQEDLLRGFDVLSRAELDIRNATQPRYHFEMAMLRWIHLRRLVPLTELLGGAGGLVPSRPGAAPSRRGPAATGSPPRRATSAGEGRGAEAPPRAEPRSGPSPVPAATAEASPRTEPRPDPAAGSPAARAGTPPAAAAPGGTASPGPASDAGPAAGLKERLLAELQRKRKFFHGTVAAQAREITVEGGRITFVFATGQRTLAQQVEKGRSWLEPLAGEVAGRKMSVAVRQAAEAASPGAEAASGDPDAEPDLRQPVLTEPPPEPPPPTEPPPDLASSAGPGPPPDLASSAGPQSPPLGPPVEPEPPDRASSPAGSPMQSAFLPPSETVAPPADPPPAPPGSPVQPGAPPPPAEPRGGRAASPGSPAPTGASGRARRDPAPPAPSGTSAPGAKKGDDLLSQAMEDPAVQTMLDVFPAEIKEVEEM